MKAVILCAGIGSRLQPLTLKTNKVLLDVKGTSIITHTVELLNKRNVEISIVIGYKAELIKDRLKGSGINFIINNFFIEYSTAYSVALAWRIFGEGPVLLIEGDIYFDEKTLDELISSEKTTCLIDPIISHNDVLIQGKNNIVDKLLFDPEHKTVFSQKNIVGRTLGMYKFDAVAGSRLKLLLKDFMDKRYTKESEYGSTYISIFNALLEREAMFYKFISGYWKNINTIKDLEILRRDL